MANSLEQNLLKELFEYKDGELIWLNDRRANKVKGKIAGSIGTDGYKRLQLNKKLFAVHRLIYIYHYGVIDDNLQIDHIDDNKLNNKIENLRLVTPSENCIDRDKGSSGYSFKKGKFEAKLIAKGKYIHIGRYDTEEEAHIAYINAKEKYHKIKERKAS